MNYKKAKHTVLVSLGCRTRHHRWNIHFLTVLEAGSGGQGVGRVVPGEGSPLLGHGHLELCPQVAFLWSVQEVGGLWFSS